MINGKQYVRTHKTRAAAERWLVETEYDNLIRYQKHPQGDELTMGQCVAYYRKEVDAKLGRAKHRALDMFAAEWGDVLAADLTYHTVLEWAERRAETVSPSTLQCDISYLRVLWRVVTGHLRQRNDKDLIKSVGDWLRIKGKVANSKKRDRRPTALELSNLKESWRTSNHLQMPLADMMEFTLITGVRVAELCRLRWEDFVDGPEPRILIRDRKDPRKKSGNDFWLPLIANSAEYLRRQMRTDERIFPYSSVTVTQRMYFTCQRLGIEGLSWHCFRHEAISRLFERGWSIPQVALISGHKSWDRATETYGIAYATCERIDCASRLLSSVIALHDQRCAPA
jgi:integrase